MPEFVPPPPEHGAASAGGFPPRESFAERFAGKITGWLQRDTGDEDGDVKGFYSTAASEAAGSVLGRVCGAFLLPAICCVWMYGLLQAADVLDAWKPFRKVVDYVHRGTTPYLLLAVVCVTGIASGVCCFIFPLAETENKARVLNWLAFLFVACCSLTISRERLAVLTLVIGQFWFHWFFHQGLVTRERRERWEWEMERHAAREEKGTRPSLMEQYAGRKEFKEADPSKWDGVESDVI